MISANQDNGKFRQMMFMHKLACIFFFSKCHFNDDLFRVLGPHREMAVDVPESFIARQKTPPRYPPPRSTTQVNRVSNAMPQVPKHANGGVSLELEPLDGYSDRNSSSLDSSSEFFKKNSSKGPSSLGSTCESIGFDSINYLKTSRGSVSTRSSSSGDLGPPEYDIGPHRELPVDVPDSFVEVIKAPPRYPPPKALIIKEVVKKKESSSSDESIDKPKPQPQAPTRNEVFFHHPCIHYFPLFIFF